MYSLLLLLHHFGARVTSIAAVRIVLLYSATLSSLENFGAQRANHVYSTAFSSPRSLALSAKLLSTARQLSAKLLSTV